MAVSLTTPHITPTSSSVMAITTTTTTTSTRSTSYALNSENLVSNLVRDASLVQDIICEFNCGGQNVNIKCSSGFYAAVAKPSLCSISEGHSLTVQAIVATVTTPGTDTTDMNGLAVNTLLKISLKTASTPASILGSLTIHLHHTTRLIQIQGNFKMPDSTPGPVWFAEHVALPMFKERGKFSSHHILGINNAILSLQHGNTQSVQRPLPEVPANKRCGGCQRAFNGKACPMPCPDCAKFFHKTTCWKSHSCSNGSSAAALAPPPITPAYSASTAAPSLVHPLGITRTLPVKRPAANITYFEVDSDDDEEGTHTPAPRNEPPLSLNPDLLQLLSDAVPPTTLTIAGSTSVFSPPVSTVQAPVSAPPSITMEHQTALQPCVSSLLSLPSSLQLQPSSFSISTTSEPTFPVSEPSRPPSKKQKKNSVPISKEAIENELLKRELDAASARITSLERELSTFKEKCFILTERIKFFEDQHTKNLHDQYFPPEPAQPPIVTRPAMQPSPCSASGPTTSAPAAPPCSSPSAIPPAPADVPQWLPQVCSSSSFTAYSASQPTQAAYNLGDDPETELDLETQQSQSVSAPPSANCAPSCSVPPSAACSSSCSPPRLPAPQSSDPCQCMHEISILKHQVSLITQELATLAPPSRADVGVQARRSENERNQRIRRTWSLGRRPSPPNNTPAYQRPPVWLPGHMPPPQPHQTSWHPQARGSRTSSAGRRGTSHPTSMNLIDLN